MKKIEAYIRPEKLDDMKEILDSLKLNGLSVTQIMGCGNQKGWKEFVRGTQIDYNFVPKIKAELVVMDEQVDSVVNAIVRIAYTGDVGDGKIFVSNIENAVRIRTGESGTKAIQ
ncbi:MAG: Nitrogen regulatory protein P-II [Firmicutes bacterium ADurb.Bin193]|nr:MAG: Nitrogen regulatory protein P-II [Firmicutes bacterium ADurb.Bin193]